jgi:hypothetical protein
MKARKASQRASLPTQTIDFASIRSRVLPTLIVTRTRKPQTETPRTETIAIQYQLRRLILLWFVRLLTLWDKRGLTVHTMAAESRPTSSSVIQFFSIWGPNGDEQGKQGGNGYLSAAERQSTSFCRSRVSTGGPVYYTRHRIEARRKCCLD